jgi:hypothetical protein
VVHVEIKWKSALVVKLFAVEGLHVECESDELELKDLWELNEFGASFGILFFVFGFDTFWTGIFIVTGHFFLSEVVFQSSLETA